MTEAEAIQKARERYGANPEIEIPTKDHERDGYAGLPVAVRQDGGKPPWESGYWVLAHVWIADEG